MPVFHNGLLNRRTQTCREFDPLRFLNMQEETNYLVPTGDGASKIAIDLVEIVKAEQRLQDVAIVNQHTAPELLSTFNNTWLKLNRSVTQLTFQKNKADNCYKNAQANAKLECTEGKLAELGHSKASADLRAAFVQKDLQVQATKDRLDEISYVLEVLRGKMEAFYNAYSSVKRLTDGKSLPPGNYGDGNRPETFGPPKKAIPESEQDPDLQPLPAGFRGK
jgi:hypothetical protein